MKTFVEELRSDVLSRLKNVEHNMSYDNDQLESARPKTFNYDSKEANALIDAITEEAATYMRLCCAKSYALDSAFVAYEDEIRVFFRVFEDADVVLLKLDDGTEVEACICGLEEMYESELDDSFDYETEPVPAEGEPEAAEEKDDPVVGMQLWFIDLDDCELKTILASHIIRAEFVDKAETEDDFDECDYCDYCDDEDECDEDCEPECCEDCPCYLFCDLKPDNGEDEV